MVGLSSTAMAFNESVVEYPDNIQTGRSVTIYFLKLVCSLLVVIQMYDL